MKSEDNSESSESEIRTDYAMERTSLARERTFSSWARTGIALMAAGLGIARLLTSVTNSWIATILGVILISTGATIFFVGYISFKKDLEKEKPTLVKHSIIVVTIISVALIIASILAIWLLFQEF